MDIKKIKRSIETCEQGYAEARRFAEELELDRVVRIIDIEIKKTREGIIKGVHKLLREAKDDYKNKKEKEASEKEKTAVEILNALPLEARSDVKEQIAAIARMIGSEELSKEEKKLEEKTAGNEEEEEKPKAEVPSEKPKLSDDEKKIGEWLKDVFKAGRKLARSSDKRLDDTKKEFSDAVQQAKAKIPEIVSGLEGDDVEVSKEKMIKILENTADRISKDIESTDYKDLISDRKLILAEGTRPKSKEGKNLFSLYKMQDALESVKKELEEVKGS